MIENDTSIQVFYNEDKSICTKINYKNGIPDGKSETYKDNLLIQEYFYENGKLSGPLSVYDNGKLKTKIEFKDGQQHGEAVYYGDNGNTIGKENYINGMKEGMSEWYTSSGEIMLRQNFHEDKLHGEKTEYHKGKVAKKYLFDNGILTSESVVKKERKPLLNLQNIIIAKVKSRFAW